MIGTIYEKDVVSAYQPSDDVKTLTKQVKDDFNIGNEILNRSWTELNDYSVIDRMNKDQRTFNAFVDESTENPQDAWKWKGTRSMARNKAIAMHAHLTSSYIVPEISAQNDDDEEDMEMADIMHDILEWMVSEENSNYKQAFLMTVMGMLTNPVNFLSADYAEVYQTIKEKAEDGKYTKKQILDEILSGFQSKVYSADQIMIVNAYEQNIQKQRTIRKRRFIDYTEAEARWGEHEHWQYVRKGIKSIYNDSDGLFYDIKDDNIIGDLVEEVTHMDRRGDLEVCFINGVYMGDTDVEANAMKHRDNRGAPKYNVIPFGYHRIGEHFFYYKSMMNSLGWDNNLIDAMYEVTMNKELLSLLMPIAVTGEENVDSDIIFPGATTAFKNPDAKIIPLAPGGNQAGYNAMQKVEQSMADGSISETEAGKLPDPNQKAYSVAQASQNAKTMLSAVGKTLGESITQFGSLMVNIATNHLSVAQIEELGSTKGKTKYKSFILNDKTVDGKKTTKRIKFDSSLVGAEMTDEEKINESMKMLEDVGYPNNKYHLYRVNPQLFARMKYLVRVDPVSMFPKNEEYQQAMMTNLYTLLRQDPLIEPEVLVRKLAYSYFRGDGEDLISKNQPQMMGQDQNITTPTSKTTVVNPLANGKSVKQAIASG